MKHISEGVLRRLDDEPLAVPDRVTEHVAACARCQARGAEIADDAKRAARLFAAPQLVPDLDAEWARFGQQLRRSEASGAGAGAGPGPGRVIVDRPRLRSPRVSLRAGLAIGAIGFVVVGAAAAASLTTIFAPTQVAPVSLSRGDLQAIASLTGLSDNQLLGGFPTPTGSTTARFGTITWHSSPAYQTTSLAQATAAGRFRIPLPTKLPTGVGAVQQFIVQPRVHATVTFNSTAGSLDGSSVTLVAGPAVLAVYTSAGGTDLPALAVATMPRPTALSSGASTGQIEAFLLRQPGVPPQLAEEVRLLGDLKTTLPVPVPSGASVRSIRVGGSPGVLLADSSNALAGVVWEDASGMLHLVAGLLDPQDVLNVAKQLG
jgi:hypothetical protein